MPRPRPGKVRLAPKDQELGIFRAIDMFFQGKSPVHKTLGRLLKRLNKAGIPYAVVGGMAVYAHGYERTTDDVDVLMTGEGLEEFRRRFVPKHYEQVEGRSRRFTDKQNQVTVDILVTGHHPGFGPPTGPITFPDPSTVSQELDSVRYIDLATLIQLKLAAQRHQDFADVVNLIGANLLDESFLPRLHQNLHQDYIECLEEHRRQQEYDAREE